MTNKSLCLSNFEKDLIDHFSLKARQIRLLSLDMLYHTQSSHIGSAMSVVDIFAVLYHKVLDTEKIRKKDLERDYVILSKGHAVSAFYATLISVGFIESHYLPIYENLKSKYYATAVKNSFPGIECSTGSLGHGPSIAVGLAIAFLHDNKKNRVYVILGDGECQEGSVWEAVNTAVKFRLNNLIFIVDKNKLQAISRSQDVVDGLLENKFKGFGCNVYSIDGHDHLQILYAILVTYENQYPSVIIANTIKGKGVSFAQDSVEWHYKSLTEDLYFQAKKEL